MEFLNSSPNYCQFSDDRSSQRLAAVRHTIITIENAAALGAQVVVLHLGWAGPSGISKKLTQLYDRNQFLSRSFVQKKIAAVRDRYRFSTPLIRRVKECLEKVVAAAEQHQIKLGWENRESFEEFPNELEMEELLKDFPTKWVGYWHDFGHAARKEFLTWHTQEETLERRRDRLIGCHIHDCRAPDEDHLPLGQGELNFPALLRRLPVEYLPVLEMSPEVTSEEIIESKKIWNSYASS